MKPSGKCILKSKNGNFKPYLLEIKEMRLILTNSKDNVQLRKELVYSIDKI